MLSVLTRVLFWTINVNVLRGNAQVTRDFGMTKCLLRSSDSVRKVNTTFGF